MFDFEKEKRKLKSIIKNIPPEKKKLVEGLIADASFMAEQLEKLRDHISKNGWSEEYQNGENQHGKKVSVEADMYVKVQKSYASVIRILKEFLPEEPTDKAPEPSEVLAAFVTRGKEI